MSELLGGTKQNETETAESFFGLPDDFKEELGLDFVSQYKSFNPDIPSEAVDESLKAYSAKFNNYSDEQKVSVLQQLKDQNTQKIQKLKQILREGADYYDNSQYGEIRRAGGIENYAKMAGEHIQQLEKELEDLKTKQKKEKQEDVEDIIKENQQLKNNLHLLKEKNPYEKEMNSLLYGQVSHQVAHFLKRGAELASLEKERIKK